VWRRSLSARTASARRGTTISAGTGGAFTAGAGATCLSDRRVRMLLQPHRMRPLTTRPSVPSCGVLPLVGLPRTGRAKRCAMPRGYSEWNQNRPHKTLADLFWTKVDKANEPSACWGWRSVKDRQGYGCIRLYNGPRRRVSAHRASWEIHFGPIPHGLCVLHRCDNPQCTNPLHLFLGTILDNNRDMTNKGRHHNQVKTHCANGHQFSDSNTYKYRNRRCFRSCNREAQRRSKS
jgi:hypothetical protein